VKNDFDSYPKDCTTRRALLCRDLIKKEKDYLESSHFSSSPLGDSTF
jgi:hypothetical protein